MLPKFLRLAAAAFVILGAVVARAAEPAIIAKARARLAPDAVLDAVTSVHYVGSLAFTDPENPVATRTAKVEFFLRKPAQQRIVVANDKTIEVKALDGYDAWTRVTDATDPTKWSQTLLSADQIRQLRADVWQNLSFFRGIEHVGGAVEDQGPATVDGIACEKLTFTHGGGIVYDRYFDVATGRLVYTGNDTNNIREEGEIVAGGIRFPQKIQISLKAGDKIVRQTITFEKITVNEPLPDSLFALPALQAH